MAVFCRQNTSGCSLLVFAIAVCRTEAFTALSVGKVVRIPSPPRVVSFQTSDISMNRRRKNPKAFRASDTSNEMDGEKSKNRLLAPDSETNLNGDQHALVKLYRGVSFLHLFQIVMAFVKYGLTLGVLNVIGGPMMAFGIMTLLGTAAKQQLLANDTFKRLNGLMVLYATLCVGLTALVPQLHSTFIWFLSGCSTLYVAVKGYLLGLRADNGKSFFPETSRLLGGASRISMALPPKQISFVDVCMLWTVAGKKVMLGWGILQVLRSAGFARYQIAPKLSQLAKLTGLGGCLVTAISIGDDFIGRQYAKVPLNLLASYVFLSMAALGIAQVTKPIELANGLLLAFCGISSMIKGLEK